VEFNSPYAQWVSPQNFVALTSEWAKSLGGGYSVPAEVLSASSSLSTKLPGE
jgi:hypothetical protein